MTCRAIIMAGGRSERMRATSGVHKALMAIAGTTLLERNISALLRQGFTDITVAVSGNDPELERFSAGTGLRLAQAVGGTLSVLTEPTSLGTIGAARLALGDADALLVVNVDNLTDLSLLGLVACHRSAGAALTIAAHVEPFRLPFGQLVLDTGGIDVIEYREKPALPVLISSGTYVVGRAAAELIPENRSFHITDLFAETRRAGRKIVAFVHSEKWIDINDEHALNRAAALFGESGYPT